MNSYERRNLWRYGAYVTVLLILSVIIRFYGLFHEPWFDEIISFVTVFRLKSALQVFSFVSETNHLLNSLFLYLVGPGDPASWSRYRLLSFAMGCSLVPAIFMVSSRVFSGRAERVIAPLFAATSFPLVLYSTEARGYSALMFFSLLSFYSLIEYLDSRRSLWLGCFYASFVLGFLSHLTFVYISAGLVAVALVRTRRNKLESLATFKTLLKLFALPGFTIIMAYSQFLLHPITYFGGTEYSALSIANSLTSCLSGCFEGTNLSYLLMIGLSIILLLEACLLLRGRNDLGIFFLAVLTACTLHFALAKFRFAHFRHFMSLYPFMIILISHTLSRLLRGGMRGKVVSAALIALIIAGNTWHTVNFLKAGRGNYAEALSFIYGHSDSRPITIASAHDFRNPLMLAFYNRMIPDQRELIYYSPANKLDLQALIPKQFLEDMVEGKVRMAYISKDELIKDGPDWFILDTPEKDPGISPLIRLDNLVDYDFVRLFPYSGELSGSHWILYKKRLQRVS
jgi:hypothetical protein